jgi:hypothetical protein
MPQEDEGPATETAPRTRIEDLPPAAEELSEEEASRAAGGMVVIRGSWETGATQYPNTCTAGNAQTGSDTDYGTDWK